jgi:hypothetical protein
MKERKRSTCSDDRARATSPNDEASQTVSPRRSTLTGVGAAKSASA